MYEGAFKLAATQMLEAHWDPQKIRTHCMLIQVLWGDRLGATPGYFEVASVEVISYADLKIESGQAVTDEDLEKCQAIQEAGGLGQANVIFQFKESSPCPGKRPRIINLLERYELEETRDPDAYRMSDVEGFVKDITSSFSVSQTLERFGAITEERRSQPGPHPLLYASIKM